ncbi:MAG: penicillin acylase family protein [Bacteroidota bacterium]
MTPRYSLGALCCALAFVVALPATGQTATDITLTATDGNTVVIDRDDFGVPHISAPTEAAAFFGQGYAVAQDRLFQMETFWRIATGRFSEAFGPGTNDANIIQDQNIRTVFYTPEERAAQFDALSPGLQAALEAYRDGINLYIGEIATDPLKLPAEFALASLTPTPWTNDKSIAVLQFFMRRFGEIGGSELTRLAEFEAMGPEMFNQLRPINDPTASTTITGQAPPITGDTPAYVNHAFPAGVVEAARNAAADVAEREAIVEALYEQNGIPRSFGSFAAVIAPSLSATGNAMLLGAPQMGLPSPDAVTRTGSSVTSEVELNVEGGIHIAGMTVPGILGVIIGRTPDRAWTLTTGFSDNTDTYVEMLDMTGTQYQYEGGLLPLQPVVSSISVAGGDDVPYTSFRTIHGPVYASDPSNPGVLFSWRYAFWDRELEMVEAFYDVWRSSSFDDYVAAITRSTMSFNLFYNDRDQDIAFWHIGVYPRRPATVDPRLPAMGDGTQEWEGFLDFATEHPQEINPTKGYFVNWNNKPAASWNQGDNVDWAATRPGGYLRTYDGVDFLDDYVRANAPISFDDLKALFRVPRFNPDYQEYPGSYQQVIEFKPGTGVVAQNVIPPGQSAFTDVNGQASAHFADQWPLYQTTFEQQNGPVQMKDFLFQGESVVSTEDEAVTSSFALGRSYPNPFQTGAALSVPMTLDAPTDVDLALYDALGRRVLTLASGTQPAGSQTIEAALDVPAGVYVLRLSADGRQQTQKVVVVR